MLEHFIAFLTLIIYESYVYVALKGATFRSHPIASITGGATDGNNSFNDSTSTC